MELNTLYLFAYNGEKDVSEYKIKINCNDIVWADIVETDGLKMKTRFSFRLELENKVHIFLENSAINVNNWLRAVKTGKRCEQEKIRAKKEELKINVDMIIWHYRKKHNQEIINFCESEFKNNFIFDVSDPEARFTNFEKAALASHKNFKYVILNY